jgi:hypothetical protein
VAEEVLDPHACCRVLELRQYALQPGGRDPLVSLFDRYFVAALEATGMHVPGLFEDLDDPDRLVWLRGFPDMRSRSRALSDFYLHGAVWREHGRAANDTMVDSDDVLLLEPAYVGDNYPTRDATRLGSAGARPAGDLVAEVVPLHRLDEVGISADVLVDRLLTASSAEGGDVLVVAVTHPEPNDFPGLPVRDEQVAVWLLRQPDTGTAGRVRARLGLQECYEQVRLRALSGSQIR